MIFTSAFVLGLVGGFHCLGMCGPIVLALAQGGGESRWRFLLSRFLYNTGRVFTYVAMGVLMGFIGQAISLAGFQQTLSITLGILILLAIFIPAQYTSKITQSVISATWWKRSLGKLFQKRSYVGLFLIGVLNGFLPCGLVYAALAGATATGDVLHSAAFMAIFGIGTIPLMLTASMVTGVLSFRVQHALNRLIPVAAVALALILILRGLNLGIPYISPVLKSSMAPIEVDGENCH